MANMNTCECGGLRLYVYSFNSHDLDKDTQIRFSVFLCTKCHQVAYKMEDKENG